MNKDKAPVYSMITQKAEPYTESGKVTTWYEDGKIKTMGYISNIPRRSISKEEADFLPNKLLNINYQYESQKTVKNLRKFFSCLSDEVYISIDLDVFDPSIMPSVGTPEPGGMNWYDVTAILKEVTGQKKILGFDVVELAPSKNNVGPDFIAAKLVYKLLGYIIANKKGE